MAEKKLNELLEPLNGRQFKRLGMFINSPYHNQNNNVTRLYSLLESSLKDKGRFIPGTDEIARNIFGGDKNAGRKTAKLIGEFRVILSSFFLNEYFLKNPDEKELALLKASRKLNFQHTFYDLKKRYAGNPDEKKKNTWDHYYRNLLLEHTCKLSRLNDIIYSGSSAELKELSESINLLFTLSKLEVYNAMLRQKNETLFNLDYGFTYKKTLLEHIEKNGAEFKKSHPYIYSYYLTLKMLEEDGSDKYFNRLKKYLLSAQHRFEPGIFKELLMDYKNSCDSKIHLNPRKYEKEIFFVYDLLDRKNIYRLEGGIEPNDFMNAVISALALNKLKRAYGFFEKYKSRIKHGGNEILNRDTIHLVKARLDFHERNYTGALLELNKIRSKQFYFYLRIRLLRIKIYYDLDEIDAVTYIIDAVKHYIKRNKSLIGSNFDIVNNFLMYLREIIRIKQSGRKNAKEALVKKLENLHSVASKDWLLEKLQAVES